MSDGGWYGYPQQEPDPYAQAQDDWNRPPLDYGDSAQAPGYPSYGQTGQPPAPQYQDYPRQQQQPRQQPPAQPGRAPQPDPRHRQPRAPQPSQNPYVQEGRPGYPAGYETGHGVPRQPYPTDRVPQAGYDGYASGGYDTSYGSGSYDTAGYQGQGGGPAHGGRGGAARGEPAQGGSAQAYAGGYDTGSQPRPGRQRHAAGPAHGQPDPYAEPRGRDPYADLAEPAEDEEYAYPSRGRRAADPPARSGRTGTRARPDTPAEDDAERDRIGLLDEDEERDGGSRGRRSGSGKKERKRRSCLAVFLAFCVLAGLLGYGGFKTYNWYESKYGPPADYASDTGTAATVVVLIPDNSGGSRIGSILYDDDVVKSQRAFTQACEANPECGNIEANTYLLHKEMSAAAAVAALLDSNNIYDKSQLLVRPGERAADVFKDLEHKTHWTQDQIVAAINSGKVDLPSWADAKPGADFPFANVEGLLFTRTYQLTQFKDPTSLVKSMIDQQLTMFDGVGLSTKAKAAGGMGLTPYQVLTVASMARAEAGKNTADPAKIAGVIYHRLKDTADFAHLGFDTTTLYGMGNTSTTPDNKDTANPYNTSVYGIKGLPPGPIDSIDQTTLEAALSPTDSTDLYFCAVDGTVLYATDSSGWAALGKAHPNLCGN